MNLSMYIQDGEGEIDVVGKNNTSLFSKKERSTIVLRRQLFGRFQTCEKALVFTVMRNCHAPRIFDVSAGCQPFAPKKIFSSTWYTVPQEKKKGSLVSQTIGMRVAHYPHSRHHHHHHHHHHHRRYTNPIMMKVHWNGRSFSPSTKALLCLVGMMMMTATPVVTSSTVTDGSVLPGVPPPPPPTLDSPPTVPSGGTKFQHFIAMNESQTCVGDVHALPFNNQIRGTNLGGWMVLEPWITPSLFYQFLGRGEGSAAFDTYTFCEVLGAKEANRQLQQHWKTWVTEEIIKEMAMSGAVNSLRVPIGDYMFRPYGVYADGCFDGSLEYIDYLLEWAYEYGLNVLFDIHTMKDSQNGFDNSGQASGFKWTTAINSEFVDQVSFEHWPIRTARWMGEFDQETATYSNINYDNIQHALDVIQDIVDLYGGHPAVLGLEPLNEPWQYTPIEELKNFYWEGYLIVKRGAPFWKYVMHDSFRFDVNIWGGFMDGCPERALDTHIYQAWRDPDSRIGFYTDACRQKSAIANMEREFGPVVVGEWSLATDNCAMWLNGFNDNLPGFPRLPCKYIPCSEPYMGMGLQPGAPPDATRPYQGPYGTGMSGPVFGWCPVDRDWLKESSGNPQTGRDWVRSPPEAPKHLDDTDNVMTHLAYKKINAFSNVGHGFYFWNFRTDLEEPQWSYMLALERGWIPKGDLNADRIKYACEVEDQGYFKCVLKRDIPDQNILRSIKFIIDEKNATGTLTDDEKNIMDMKGKDLQHLASDMIGEYFESHRSIGMTCDFGGIAFLVEENRTITDDDSIVFDDDEYQPVIIYRGLDPLVITLIVLVAVVIGSIGGFFIAMHANKKFNEKVKKSTIFRSISRSSNPMIRRSFALDSFSREGELESLLTNRGMPKNARSHS